MKTIDPSKTTTTTTPTPAHPLASPPPAARTAGNDNAQPTPGNDNAVARGGADATALLAHPEFVAYVRGVLVRHGRRRTLEDDTPEVQLRVLEAARLAPMPADLERWKALGATIARCFAIDERKKKKVREKYDVGLCEEPDAYGFIERPRARDPVDTRRYLGVLKERFDSGAMPARGGEILWGAAEHVPREQIAEETGLMGRQVKRRLGTMRERFSQKLDELGLRDGEHTPCDKSSSKGGPETPG